MDFKGKKVLVVGAARSGLSAARLLNSLGAEVTLSDSKQIEQFKEAADEMKRLGVKVCAGQNAGYALVKEQALIISSPGIPANIDTFVIARNENIPVMGEMELAYTLCPCPVAAITGTNGKTTTAALTGEIIGSHIADTKVVGNIGRPFSDCVSELTENSFAVIEASSFQLEETSVFKPKICAVLNITPDHLDRHKTMKRYIEAKANIYKNTDENCFVILNKDDPVLSRLNIDTGAKLLYFSASGYVDEGACVEDGYISLNVDGRLIRLISKDELQILGAHNVENALAAALIAKCAGVPENMIAKALAEFKGVPHRMEFVRELRGVKYYNDSKGTNPDASIKALNSVDGKTVLIAGGYDKEADFTEFVSLFSDKLSYLIALGETKEKLINACEEAGFGRYVTADSYEQAVQMAFDTAVPGENVLLSPACASWDMFSDFEERGGFYKQLVNKLK